VLFVKTLLVILLVAVVFPMPHRAARIETGDYYTKDRNFDESVQEPERSSNLTAVAGSPVGAARLSGLSGSQIKIPPRSNSEVIVIPLKSTRGMKAYEWVILIVLPLMLGVNLMFLYRRTRRRHLGQPVQQFRDGGLSHLKEKGQRVGPSDAGLLRGHVDSPQSFVELEPGEGDIDVECLSVRRSSADCGLARGVQNSTDQPRAASARQ